MPRRWCVTIAPLAITMDNVETKSPIGEENNLILVILRYVALILGNFVIFLKKTTKCSG